MIEVLEPAVGTGHPDACAHVVGGAGDHALEGGDRVYANTVGVAKKEGLYFTKTDHGCEVLRVPAQDMTIHVERFFPLSVARGDDEITDFVTA